MSFESSKVFHKSGTPYGYNTFIHGVSKVKLYILQSGILG